VNIYADSVTTEAKYKITYNMSIVGLEEAKGMLLEHDEIALVEGPKSAMTAVGAPDGATKPAFFEPWAVTQPPAASMPTAPPSLQPTAPIATGPVSRLSGVEPQAKNSTSKAESGGKTFSFEMTVKFGSLPVEIRGSFATAPVRSVDSLKQ
jgi:hypothetical protein